MNLSTLLLIIRKFHMKNNSKLTATAIGLSVLLYGCNSEQPDLASLDISANPQESVTTLTASSLLASSLTGRVPEYPSLWFQLFRLC